jgi:hypothetical protein
MAAISQLNNDPVRSQQLVKAEPVRPYQVSAGDSQLFALAADVQFELKSLKGHQHTPKLIPSDFPAVNYEKRQTAIFSVIPFNRA